MEPSGTLIDALLGESLKSNRVYVVVVVVVVVVHVVVSAGMYVGAVLVVDGTEWFTD